MRYMNVRYGDTDDVIDDVRGIVLLIWAEEWKRIR